MVTKVKEEYVAAGIRKQIEMLSHVIQEMESERLHPEALSWRLRAVELQLRNIREAA